MTSSDPRLHTGQWRTLRLYVLDRDGWVCQVKDKGCTQVATQVDHIVPPLEGGSFWDLQNLRSSCVRCNARRGARLSVRRGGGFTYRTSLPPTQTRL